MKFKATSTLILWHDGQMHVFNPGDKGDLPEAVIGQYIPSQATELKGNAKPEKAPAVAAAAPAPDAPVADADAPPV